MRDELELSVMLNSYFGRCIAAGYKMPVEEIAFQNLYATQTEEFEKLFDPQKVRDITMINSLAGAGDGVETTFVDDSWRMKPPKFVQNVKSMRIDKWSKGHSAMLGQLTGLERMYLINERRKPKDQTNGTPNGTRSQGESPCTPSTPATTPGANSVPSLGKEYIEVLSTNHGPSLRHLLLAAQWRLDSDDIAKLFRSCPNLEQLGLGVEKSDSDLFRVLIQFLPRLSAIRILDNPESSTVGQELKAAPHSHERKLALHTSKRELARLRWVGWADMVFSLGRLVPSGERAESGEPLYTRSAKKVPLETVRHVEIWGLDSLEI